MGFGCHLVEDVSFPLGHSESLGLTVMEMDFCSWWKLRVVEGLSKRVLDIKELKRERVIQAEYFVWCSTHVHVLRNVVCHVSPGVY